LEAAGICENGTRPRHEFVETAHPFNAFMAGPEEEMVGVREDDFGVKVVGEVAWREPFDGALRADGHENRGFYNAVGRVEQAGTSAGLRAGGLDFEAKI
jgi:hypothetical protein